VLGDLRRQTAKLLGGFRLAQFFDCNVCHYAASEFHCCSKSFLQSYLSASERERVFLFWLLAFLMPVQARS
jgi:hypothetical protein